jgi:hypothetical protein
MVAIRWEVESAPQAREIADGLADGDIRPQIGNLPEPGQDFAVPLIPLIVGAVVVVKLSMTVYDFIRKWTDKGLVIDLSQNPVEIREDGGVPGGVALVIAKDGTSVEVKNTVKFESLDEIIKAGLGSLSPQG